LTGLKYRALVDFIFRGLLPIEYAKLDSSVSDQHSERSANSISYELGRPDFDIGIFPWSSYRALPHFFLRPKIELVIDDYRKEQWKHDIPLIQDSPAGLPRRRVGNIRLITIVVFNYGAYRLEKATVHVHILKKEKRRRRFIEVGFTKWAHLPDVKVAWDTEPSEAVYNSVDEKTSESDVAQKVREKILSKYTTTIDPRYEKVAVVAFAVQGHANAYLTDTKATPLQIGQDHSLLISVSGRNMQSTRPRRYCLSLKDWEHLSLD